MNPHFSRRDSESDSNSPVRTKILTDQTRNDQLSIADVSAEALVEFVAEHGTYYDSYLATEPGRLIFWSINKRGMISYVRRGKYIFVGGGPIAPNEHKVELLQQFLAFTEANSWTVMFHCITDEDLTYFQQVGCQVTKLGEEAVVDLGNCRWTGKQYEWLRRQTNYCLRHDLQIEEVLPHKMAKSEWDELFAEVLDVAAQTLALKPQKEEMRFFEGQIDHHPLGKRRLFVAKAEKGNGRVEGFVVCNPMRGGSQWALEMYRHRVDSVRGTVPFLFHHILNQFQDEGVKLASLSLIPALRSEYIPGDSPWVRVGLNLTTKYCSAIFDLNGMAHFKSRFRPRFVNRYTCAYPKATFGAVMSFMGLFGLLKLDYAKLIKILFHRIQKRKARQTLADLNTDSGKHEGEQHTARNEPEIEINSGKSKAA